MLADIFDIHPQALIILVVMIVGALRWFFETMKNKKAGPDEEEGNTFEDLYEEARREILERQRRQPQAEAPPSPTTPQPSFEPQPTASPPPQVTFQPPISPTQSPATPPPLPGQGPSIDYNAPRTVQRPTLTAAEQAALERIQGEELTVRHRRRHRGPASGVRRLLASPAAARDAIVLREILGPPKGAR